MSVILIEKDPFVEAEASTFTNSSAEQFNIRRPFFGVQVKQPRHAFISIYQDGGNGNLVPISMKDSSAPGGWSNANHNLILTDVTETRQEKVQIMETFGDNYAFFYGEKAIILNCAGMLIDTADFNWKNEWWYNYNHFLRGTKCVENRARVFLGFDDTLVQGYILNCSAQYSKDQPNLCPISFSILLAKQPLDLSSAAADEVPALGSTDWVNQAAEARTYYFKTSTGENIPVPFTLVEYIGALQGLDGTGENARYSINPLTGDSEPSQGFSPDVPDSIDNGRTATWVSEANPRARQWRTTDEALLELNTKIAAQQAGTDEVTARQALRANPAGFQLASRTTSVTTISSGLGKGISNSAAVIPTSSGVV